jgi:DNA (cytosine-5)-methyltransferase 1
MLPSSDITVTDLFAGAGGSSTGMAMVDGVRIVHAANHWKLALDTHATNHPDTNHDYCDLRQAHPSQFPKTTILWASPECTNHAVSKGRKRKALNQLDLWGETGIDPSEERSRSTMREVIEFSEYHRYEAVIVENVSEIRLWSAYQDWLKAMMDLGYLYKEVFFNSRHAHPTPQSRDRIYVVFWKKGNKAPDLDIRPLAYCMRCEKDIESRFSPNPKGLPGRVLYSKSYVYSCPRCGHKVEPYYYAAFNAIDWSLPVERIGDRERPLADATMKRIERGLNKYKGQYMVIEMSRPKQMGHIYTISQAIPTVTTRGNLAVAMPFVSAYYTGDDDCRARSVDQVLGTVPTENRFSLVMPSAFTYAAREFDSGKGVDEAMKTVVASANQHALVTTPAFVSTFRFNNEAKGLNEPMPTSTTAVHEGLVVPAPVLSTLRGPHTGEGLDKAMTSIVGTVQQALVIPQNFISTYYGNGGELSVDSAAPAMTSREHHALIQPEPTWDIKDAGFRMLQPHEIKIAMGFPSDYVILGNKGEQVKQAGNAVTPPVSKLLVERVVASLM